MKSILRLALALTPVLYVPAVHAEDKDIQLKAVEIPNDIAYWKNAGFAEMVPPTRLPTVKEIEDVIQVWVKVPDDGRITVDWLEDQKRFTLKFPPGSVADRVETLKNAHRAMQVINGILDVRGARIGNNGETYFHVYEPVPGSKEQSLKGYEWLRINAEAEGPDVLDAQTPGAHV